MKDIDKVKDKSLKMGRNAIIYFRKHPTFEVKISTESFWLPMTGQSFLTFFIALIGRKRIHDYMQDLENRNRYRLLAFFVGLAGKYWYWTGVKEAMKLK